MFTLTDLEFGGAGGLIAGLLIGLLLPAIQGQLLPAGKTIGNPDFMPDLDAGSAKIFTPGAQNVASQFIKGEAKIFKGGGSFFKKGQGSTGESGAGGPSGAPTGQSGPGTGGGGGGSTGQSGPGTGGGMGESTSN